MAPLPQKYEPHTEVVEIDVQNDLAHLAYTGGRPAVLKVSC